MTPLFGPSSVPPPIILTGDRGGTGAVCRWCMAPLEGQPIVQGFFCSKACAVAYMLADPKKPEADGCAAQSQLLGPGPHHRG